ncbi:MAG: phosphatase PAP2 family protein [Ruminococcaceae bacterium]|mgnify:CR=1 FL=1|nr:phosphatase PAP2 family protein [Oscillospiraceae bacterium]
MNRTARTLAFMIPAILVYAAGFVAAAFWDFTITSTLYDPQNLFAILMECFGWYPAFVPTILLALLWMARPPLDGRRWMPVVCGVVAAAGFAIIYIVARGYMLNRGLLTGGPEGWIWLAVGIALAALMVWGVLRAAPATREKLVFFALAGSVMMAANQVATYIIKAIWQRPRFDDMLATGSFDAFRAWYEPFGPGGSSFPSGHTANAACILVLLVLCDLFPAWRRRRGWVLAFCWVFIAAMALARMWIGRHFLSDTLAASGVMALLFFAMRRTKLYQKALRRTLETSEGLRQGGKHAV